MKIGYVTFGRDTFGYGLAYVIYKHKIKAKRASVVSAKHFDILLFSIFWWQHVYDFIKFCHDAKIGKKEKPHIIVGGFNSFNPHVFFPWADQVVVGDGEDVILSALKQEYHESIYTGKEKEVLYATADIINNSYAYKTRETKNTRIEIARGCKYACPYCQLTYLKKYREVSLEAVKQAIDTCTTKSVALFAPNGMTHSNYKEIMAYLRFKKLKNIASDVRYNEIDMYDNHATARLGLEGISYKLRKSVTKPITNEGLVKLFEKRSKACIDLGITPSIHAYFIMDLPGETEDDWKEFDEFMLMLNDMKYAKDFTFIVTGNVFMPCPHTPYENKTINLDIDYKQKFKKHLSDGGNRNKFKYSIGGRHSIFGRPARLLSMVATKAGPEHQELLFNLATNKKLRKRLAMGGDQSINALIRYIEKNFCPVDTFTGVPKDMPWKVVKVKKEKKKKRDTLDH